jgi:mono/diheme cytochrome c family protein
VIAMPSRPHRFVVVLAAALASQTGCGDREKSAAATSAPPPPTTAGRDAAPVAPPPLAPIDATIKQHMQEHFASITEVQRAVVRSDLPAAQAAARYLAEHVEHEALDGWGPHVAAVRQAAERVVHAADVPAAGLAAASLGRTCARCHHARSAIVAFAWEPEPEADASLVAQMRRHQWAAARLWDGLVGPSDQLWTEGAAALAAANLDQVAAQAKAGAADITRWATRVRELARRAGTLTDDDARAELYGQLLEACASCHQVARDPARGLAPPAPAPAGP